MKKAIQISIVFGIMLATTSTAFSQKTFYFSPDATVNVNDSVVIRLNDYQGDIQWQKSIDMENWENIPDAVKDTLLFVADTTSYFRAEVIAGDCDPFYSDTTKVEVYNLPAVSTHSISNITSTTAQSGGNITDDGGSPVTARGVVWSTTENPTTESNEGLTTDGTGLGEFTSELTGLSPETTYYVRAYATNEVGIAYGQQEEFTTQTSTPDTYILTLQVTPEGSGEVNGAGEYAEGATVPITATPNENYEFVNWTGDTQYIADANVTSTTVTMPAQNITLKANFEGGGGGNGEPGEGVTDIDGNFYPSVIIGNQEWMAENLRVTKYNNGDPIPANLTNNEWENTTNGASTIYNNENDMLEAYGRLYNFFAVDDPRGLCPAGWHIPSNEDWTELFDYLVLQGYSSGNSLNSVGNVLKSCRQISSPLGGDCATTDHPRWNWDDYMYGTDEFNFSALPGGYRDNYGSSESIGYSGAWWSAKDYNSTIAFFYLLTVDKTINLELFNKASGFSVRCFRSGDENSAHSLNLDVTPEGSGEVTGEGDYPEGTTITIIATPNMNYRFVNWTGDTEYITDANALNTDLTMPGKNVSLTANFEEDSVGNFQPGDGVTDIDGNFYPSVIIGNQEWMAENLKTTKYRNATPIAYPGTDNTAWENDSTGAYAWYNNDIALKDSYGALYNWHAVDNSNGLCPTGWHVPSSEEWIELVDYIVAQGNPNEWDNPNGAGNALKSCRQVSSPLGGDCATSVHPRWDSHSIFYGTDEFGFSALPGGIRNSSGIFNSLGIYAYWWTFPEHSPNNSMLFNITFDQAKIFNFIMPNNSFGISVRCLKD